MQNENLMKIKYFLFWNLLFSVSGYSQSVKDSVQLRTLLFNHFIEGIVLMKSGAIEKAPLNYNTDNQSIVFINNDQYMTLTELETIDTIYIDDKKFVPVKETIYEVVTPSEDIPLFVSYTNKIRPIVATVDHNGGSKQAGAQVSNTVSDTYVNRTFRGNYTVEFIRHFLLKKRYSFYKISNEKQVIKVFPESETAIRQFIAENQTNFSSLRDIANLVIFCNEQNKKKVHQ